MSAPYEATWGSLTRWRTPAWYADARFGIFVHWGPYCVPAFGNEWYPRNMYAQGTAEFRHHVQTYGPQSRFGYKDFLPLFRAERFDPDAWADLFRRAGARYVVPVAEHHDGFAMYDCSFSRWNCVQMGPMRDVVGELADSVRRAGMVFGLSSHREEHWWFMGRGMEFDSDVRDPRYADFYGPAMPFGDDWSVRDWVPRPDGRFLEEWLARTCELVDKYRPQLVWFDGWINQIVFQPYLQRFAAHYYNRGAEWGLEVAINYKGDTFPEGAAVLDIERGQLDGIRPLLWQNDTSISRSSWGYVREQDYKAAGDIVGDLADVVSKNGCLLLNVGPRADGTIPEPEREVLLEVGRWLEVNGEAIHGSRPWHTFGEGPTEVPGGAFTDTRRGAFTSADFRFTTRDGAIYAICLSEPRGETLIRSLGLSSGSKVTGVRMLGSPQELAWRQEETALRVTPPSRLPCAHACAYRVTLR